MTFSTAIVAIGGFALGCSLAFNAFLYVQNKALTQSNAELAATVEVLNKARAADVEALEEHAKLSGEICERTEARQKELLEALGEDASDDVVLARLRGMFKDR